MGRIYLGRAAGLGGFERKVVIKTLEVPLTSESDQAIAMFLDEARLLGLLHHQHISSVFEVGRDEDGRHYMVLDYLEGHSAHDVWERALQFGAALPLDFTLTVVSAIANALHYTHTRSDIDGTALGIVHRDVTPSNVMIGHDGAVKLIDFGIAMAAHRKTKTQTGFVKGKVSYLSPEQVAGRDVDARTDVFALGILLYELSTLTRAFRDSSDLATMQRIKAGKVVRPSLVVPDYPAELEGVVMKALQVEPRDRFANADAMRRAIEALGHRLRFVLGDAAVIEVMLQLYEPQGPGAAEPAASRASDPAFEWSPSEHDLTVRRDPAELLAVLRRENAVTSAVPTGDRRPIAGGGDPRGINRPRKLRAATEAADALIVQSVDVSSALAPAPLALPLPAVPHVQVATPKPSAAPSTLRGAPPSVPPADPVGFAATVLPRSSSVRPVATPRATAKPFAAPAGTAKQPSRVIGASLVQAHSHRSPRLRWIAAVAALAVAGGVVYVVTRKPAKPVAAAPSPPVAPVAARAPQVTPPPPKPAHVDPPPAPTKVRVRIVTHPADATVLLDGKRLGHTPLDETLAADPAKHVIKLRHPRYATHRLDVTLDADITEDITLASQR